MTGSRAVTAKSGRAIAALRELALPHRSDEGHVRFGYLFQCITVRRDP